MKKNTRIVLYGSLLLILLIVICISGWFWWSTNAKTESEDVMLDAEEIIIPDDSTQGNSVERHYYDGH